MQLKYASFVTINDCSISASGSIIPVSWTPERIGAGIDSVMQNQTDDVHTLTGGKEKRLGYVSVKLVRPNVVGT